jgi:hypothetical protein
VYFLTTLPTNIAEIVEGRAPFLLFVGFHYSDIVSNSSADIA